MKIRLHQLALILIALALPLTAAKADVTFNFVQLSVSALSPGTSGTVELRLQITGAEQVRGVDFFFTSLDLSTGQFFIASRDTTGSDFPDVFFSNGTVIARPGSDLDPENDVPLTQGLEFSTDPSLTSTGMPAGGWLIASYTIGVDLGVAPGSYTIATSTNIWTDENGSVHVGTAGDFELVVVPEPATWSLLGLGGLGALGLSLLRARRKS